MACRIAITLYATTVQIKKRMYNRNKGNVITTCELLMHSQSIHTMHTRNLAIDLRFTIANDNIFCILGPHLGNRIK